MNIKKYLWVVADSIFTLLVVVSAGKYLMTNDSNPIDLTERKSPNIIKKMDDRSYVITFLGTGDQIVCESIKKETCGLNLSKCDDMLERFCITNVTVRQLEP